MSAPADIEAHWSSIDDMPRFLRTAAVGIPPGGSVSICGLEPKELLQMARRIEDTAPRLVVVYRRDPISHRDAVFAAAISASAFIYWVSPLVAVIIGALQ